MTPGVVLLANLGTAAALLGAAVYRVRGRASVALAVVPLVNAVLVTVYVFGEDSYRDNGISRWDAYRSPGGALGPMFVFFIALLAACAAVLAYTAFRRSGRAFRITAVAGGLTALVLGTATIIGFTAN